MRVVGLAMALVPAMAFASDVAPMGQMPESVRQAAEASRDQPLVERIDAVSRVLLDVPYVGDPLGEGQGPDTDPLVRYDAFDCLTFVEEVLALSLSPDPAHAADVRLDLRYGGDEPTYANRHHFMELQWIPSAIERGWLVETTADYGPVQTYRRDVGPELWSTWRSRSRFSMTDDELPTGTMELNYLPLDAALAAVQDIRPGSIVMTVREDRAHSPIWISHLGIVVPGERPTIRHASRMRSVMATRDHGLAWYIEQLMAYKNWKAVGVAIFEPLDTAPRRTAIEER